MQMGQSLRRITRLWGGKRPALSIGRGWRPRSVSRDFVADAQFVALQCGHHSHVGVRRLHLLMDAALKTAVLFLKGKNMRCFHGTLSLKITLRIWVPVSGHPLRPPLCQTTHSPVRTSRMETHSRPLAKPPLWHFCDERRGDATKRQGNVRAADSPYFVSSPPLALLPAPRRAIRDS